MRITVSQLRRIIKEEVKRTLGEHWHDADGYGDMGFRDPGGAH